ncbi:MAG: aminotransferase class V-fold PLP-dependent enzyme [Actinobacteria bacterium]|nr:aminotransferase class V-fold PLP-dependent enzyme [Actinomycetota bacterium]
MQLPAPPSCAFASDNAAGAHPLVLDALVQANRGHALAYGDDAWTTEAEARFRDLFGPASSSLLVWNGTGANVLALAAMARPADSIVCTNWAHIAVDETGAPERIVGSKLSTLTCDDAKIVPEQLTSFEHLIGVQHHAQPGVLSITQSTELGTLYTADEVAALCDAAHRLGMTVHLDGARIANATAALGGTVDALRSFTVDAGVDVVSFGGTKAGMAFGEAVVFLNPELARRATYIRKMVTQLPSKMRFVAAQFNALLHDELWIRLARHANEMATRLHEATAHLPGLEYPEAPAVNSVFPLLPPHVIEPLREWCFFWDWDTSRADGRHQVRWMTAWDTTPVDVQRFAAGVAAALTAGRHTRI